MNEKNFDQHKKLSNIEMSLADLRPDIANEWHTTKNGNLTPKDVSVDSNKKAWWECDCGHEWMAHISNRAKYGYGCPFCANIKHATKHFAATKKGLLKMRKRSSAQPYKPVTSKNNLAFLRPDVAAEWHPKKNGSLAPRDVTISSDKRVWWKGDCGHEWMAAVRSRAQNFSGCPYCANSKHDENE